MSDESNARSAL